MNRILIGLAVGSGLEGVDVTVIRAHGTGLDLTPHVLGSARIPFPPSTRDLLKTANNTTEAASGSIRNVAETAAHALRNAVVQAGLSLRDVFTAGLLEPSRPGIGSSPAWVEIADRIAELSGITLIHNFRARDRALGGSGHPIGATADFLLFRSTTEERLLVHLGAVASLVLVPAQARVFDVIGFESGPGNQLLDTLTFHGTRGRELLDAGGKKAVQGQRLESLLQQWLDHPHITRKPPKSVHTEAFARSFLLAAFENARQSGASLADLLCSATHLVAHSLGDAMKKWLPPPKAPRRILLSGGGVRNGFLWQLLAQQSERMPLERLDALGLSPLARNAASAAVLAGLMCDGVAGNAPHLTGAAGARALGQIAPGDRRNWARCAGWLADQINDSPRTYRAA